MESQSNYLLSNAKETLLLPVLLYYFTFKKIAMIVLLFLVYFFRNPVNGNGIGNGNVLYAPSYGTLENIEKVNYQGIDCFRFSVFLGLLDPHLCYSPCDGILIDKEYYPGTFKMANLGKKTELNERLVTTIRTKEDKTIKVIQIAGMLVRRIVSLKEKNKILRKGEEIGLIKFGSRVDLVIPSNYIKQIYPLRIGQKIYGSETKFVEMF